MPTQQAPAMSKDERIADLIRQVDLYKDAEIAMLARARKAEDELERMRFISAPDTYVVTVLGGRRIYGKKEDVETIQAAIDMAISRGCSHCSDSIAKARAALSG